jgi:ketosteroid isomerase-like protein
VAPLGVVFAGPELVVGPSAVRAYYASQDAAAGLAWHPVFARLAGSGDLGFTIGQYIFTGRGASGAAVQSFGKYMTVWQRQPDGSWKFVVDGGNANPAPRAELRR